MIDNQKFYAEVGSSIRQARKNIGLSQEALASLVSITRTSVTNIEKFWFTP
ncbi:helix-turn-helix domain-containing protein [Mastigocoleus sp. MO_188.B34]|uniref:helix-turn-helix transcriptional regulator n=1 Tax=Mastigocoleus sp. MO_188.B34 TaxID=3036635 RepID=UPI00261DCC8C|nr:helix-turn-helix domain-containing protein [Mastigocoleus sp. MO_188.B34]MDJ0694644.1 helix-turn-helix domain-containing protein [Mastigocoleus sp. MO_188.B34]